jgi:DNA-binding transcriptional LysR family regulator
MRDWDGIEEFVAVVTTGSFQRAATMLRLSTSHVSRAVQRLEARIGLPLLLRTTRKVSLTETGRHLIEPFRRLVHDRDEALAAASEPTIPTGELRVTCSVGIGERFISPVVRNFALEHPQLRITLDLSNRLVDLVAEGYDLAIRTGNLSDSSLVGTRIGSRRLICCAAPAYLDANGTPETLADLATHDCLVGTAQAWHFFIEGKDVAWQPRPRWRCNSGLAVTDAAIAGLGICQLPAFYVEDALARGDLLKVLDPIRREDEPIWAVHPQRRHVPAKVRLLTERLRQELSRLAPTDARLPG